MNKVIEIERTFSQNDFDEFARISGDKNPIHVDAEFSASTGFGRNVAHGLLICTVLRGLCGQLLPNAKQLLQEVKFTAPTFADEVMLFSAEVVENKTNTVRVSLLVKRLIDGIVTCEGQTIMQSAETKNADR